MTGMQHEMLKVCRAMTNKRAERFLVFEALGRLQSKDGDPALRRLDLTGQPELTVDLRPSLRPGRQRVAGTRNGQVNEQNGRTRFSPEGV